MLLFEGHICWKSAIEYNPEGGIYGTPYFIITQDEEKLYFYQYEIASKQYVKIKEVDESHFDELYEEGCAKEEKLRKKLRRQSR